MRVLVVEDEAAAASFLRKGLRKVGHAVDIAVDGDEALYKVSINDYDVMLLDVGLGAKSGMQVCREIRAANIKMSILMLTARDGVEDRVLGLDCGADDYLTKPYQLRELLARMRALDRRGPIRHLGVLNISDLSLDLQGRRASRCGSVIDLTSKEYALLEFMAQRTGQIVTRSEISEHVWDEGYDPFSNIIDVYIQRLRRKLDEPFESRLIHTHRGVGYMLGLKPGPMNA